VEIAMVRRRVQTRIERKRTGPAEWLVVTRRPLTDDRTLEPRASRDATDQDERYHYHYYLSPTCISEAELKEPSLAELARVIKAGACIEASFKRGKGEVGMDEYRHRRVAGATRLSRCRIRRAVRGNQAALLAAAFCQKTLRGHRIPYTDHPAGFEPPGTNGTDTCPTVW